MTTRNYGFAVRLGRRNALQVLAGACAPLIGLPSFAALAGSHGDPQEAEGYPLMEVADGVFVHTGRHELQLPTNLGDISNAGFVVGRDAVAVIDTGGSYAAGAKLRSAIAERTSVPIRHVINTHMHPDHVLGNAAFTDDTPTFYGHAKLARALQARAERYLQAAREALGDAAFAKTTVVLPGVAIGEPTTIDLGGRSLELRPQETAHTDNDLFIVDSKSGFAFAGDLIFAGHVPALDGSILGWREVLELLGEAPPNSVVPGHGPAAMAWGEAAEPMLRYLDAVIVDVRGVIAKGGTITEAMNTAALGEAQNWELFDEFHRRNVSAAFAELEWE